MGSMSGSDFTPPYMREGGDRGRHRGFVPVNRGQNNSMQGRKKPQKIIEAKPSSAKTTLKTTENAWVGLSKKAESLDKLTQCKSQLTGMLNKLCPDNYHKIKDPFKQLVITYNMFFSEIIQLLFDKAVTEQHFSPTYAKLCKSLTENNKNDKKQKEKDDNKSNQMQTEKQKSVLV